MISTFPIGSLVKINSSYLRVYFNTQNVNNFGIVLGIRKNSTYTALEVFTSLGIIYATSYSSIFKILFRPPC